ncbi:MAG TPA: diguanylate cyclase [Desulfobacterales bacterium]|nr:diguanylate cyclase [Desulfobacterales bacterium]
MDKIKEKLLIVDDETITLELLINGALGLDLDIQGAASAEEAWDYFQAHKPRLIVLDWNLPGMSGLELCQRLRSAALGKYLSILVVTSNDRPEDMERVLAAGADFYMPKPISIPFYKAWLASARQRVSEFRGLEESDNKVAGIKAELEDVNDQLEATITQANELAMESEKNYLEINQIFKTVAGGILVVDNDYNIIKHNDNFLGLLEDEVGSAVNMKCYDVFRSSLCDTEDCPLNCLRRPGQDHFRAHIVKERTGGGLVHYNIVSTPLRGLVGEQIGIVEHITDISQQVAAEEALKESERRYRELSTVDELTGLFNKRYFNQVLQMELNRTVRYGGSLSLIMMDIDNFKLHNDTYGHAEGDKVLARLGEIVKGAVRDNDVACRYGGEEFVVILPATAGQGGLVVAERIREIFAAERFCEGQVQKTLSLGVAEYVAGDNREIFIKRADANLYEAKESGKNRCVLK